MGKRELFILMAFVLVGTIAYQLTAPPPKEGSRRSTLSTFLQGLRESNRANTVGASIDREGTFPASKTLKSLRLSAAPNVTVVGEDRGDIGYTLSVTAMGPDEATARRHASETTLRQDDLGDVLALVLVPAATGRPTATLVLKVPNRLAVRIDGSRRTSVSGVATVYLDNLIGDAEIRGVPGNIGGSHRNGTLTVTDSGGLSLTLVASKAVLTDVRGPIALNARNGETRIRTPQGSVEIEQTSVTLIITEPAASVSVTGTGGDITIDRPAADVKVDVRRAAVSLALSAPVTSTIFTTDAAIRLILTSEVPVAIDAVAMRGAVTASDFHLTATRAGDETKLMHSFGNRARVALRTERGEIVIAQRK
jgi:hypothetical protein